MRTRKHLIKVYLDDEEAKRFEEWVKATHMTKSAYLRELIAGSRPVAFPPMAYTKILAELRRLGVNMNQLAAKAHALGFIDEPEYRKNAQAVWALCAAMAQRLTERRSASGSHQDLGGEVPAEPPH